MRYFRNANCLVLAVLFASITESARAVELANSPVLETSDTSYWQAQTTGVADSTLNAVSAVDRNVCWMAGRTGRILRTADGGHTWLPVNSGIIGTQDVQVIEGVSDSVAFAGTTTTDTTYIYRTTDAGSTWTKVFAQHGGHIDGLKMFNPNHGIAVGDPVGGTWTILKTTDRGETWYRSSSEPAQISGASGGRGFGALDTANVWFFDNYGRWYLTISDSGTWSVSDSSGVTRFMWMNTPEVILIVDAQATWRRGPVGWELAGHPFCYPFCNPPAGLVGALSTTEYWFVQRGVYRGIYYTPDEGNTWTVAPPNGLGGSVTLIDMVTLGSDVSAWAVGVGDTVYHYQRLLTGVDERPQSVPREFSLNQNFPNPFNPSTVISFQLPVSGFVTLKVYNMLGQEVGTLVNELKQAGRYEVSWDALGSASGIYFYRISAGKFVETRKLLLLR